MDDRTLTALKASPTPAPWTYSGGEVLDAQGNQIAHLNDSWRDPAEDDANGLLMAAAPDLLTMLKVAQLWLDVDGRFDMQGINAAIAKSEGK